MKKLSSNTRIIIATALIVLGLFLATSYALAGNSTGKKQGINNAEWSGGNRNFCRANGNQNNSGRGNRYDFRGTLDRL